MAAVDVIEHAQARAGSEAGRLYQRREAAHQPAGSRNDPVVVAHFRHVGLVGIGAGDVATRFGVNIAPPALNWPAPVTSKRE